MRGEQINRVSSIVIIGLSLTSLLTVLSGYTHPPQPPEPDEEAAAHIFQLSIAALVPTVPLLQRLVPGRNRVDDTVLELYGPPDRRDVVGGCRRLV